MIGWTLSVDLLQGYCFDYSIGLSSNIFITELVFNSEDLLPRKSLCLLSA